MSRTGIPSIGDIRRSAFDDVVAGIVSHIISCVKSARDFMWALIVLGSLATLLLEVSYCERITTL
jgi:hypothetical protein